MLRIHVGRALWYSDISQIATKLHAMITKIFLGLSFGRYIDRQDPSRWPDLKAESDHHAKLLRFAKPIPLTTHEFVPPRELKAREGAIAEGVAYGHDSRFHHRGAARRFLLPK